jgi:hypothetical protein
MSIKGFSSSKKAVPNIPNQIDSTPLQEYATLSPVTGNRYALDTATKGFKPLSLTPITLDATQPTNRPDRVLNITAHGARKGDVIKFLSGALIDVEIAILKVVDANQVIVDTVLDSAPFGGVDTIQILRGVNLQLSSDGSLATSAGPIQYNQDGVAAVVTKDGATPANNRYLPSEIGFSLDGVDTSVSKDTATPANSIPLPIEHLAADGTVLAVATEAKQDDAITQLTALNVDTDAILAEILKLEARVAGDLVPETFDFLALTYVAAGNGLGEIETVTYRVGGSGGTIVKTITLTYDAQNRIATVTAA